MNIRLCIFILLLCTSKCISYAQIIGANYNEGIDEISSAIVKDSKVEWVRTFININTLLQYDAANKITGVRNVLINSLNGIDSMVMASNLNNNGKNVKLILSLKFNFKHKNVGVPDVNSADMTHYKNAVLAVLNSKKLGEHVDILVVGNEPMWETENEEANKLAAFTNHMIDEVAAWKAQKTAWKYKIYAGALNRAGELKTNPIRNAILQVAKTNPKVEGLDLHLHVIDIPEVEKTFTSIRKDEGFTKDIIVTEFSLNRLFESKISTTLGTWGTQNGYTSTLKLYEWINALIDKSNNGTPVSPSEFTSFFNSRTWYPKYWFSGFYESFCKNNVSIATYGILRAKDANFKMTEESPVWILNAYFNEALLGNQSNGLPTTNPLFDRVFLGLSSQSINCQNLATKTKEKKTLVPMKVFPNPGNGENLIIELPTKEQTNKVELLNLEGKIVFSKDITATGSFNLSTEISSGIYFTRVYTNSGVYTQKIVIR